MSVKFDTDSYSECYPGTKAEEDVNIDSDEEVDFTKMDLVIIYRYIIILSENSIHFFK